jgi:hypothetical protein
MKAQLALKMRLEKLMLSRALITTSRNATPASSVFRGGK